MVPQYEKTQYNLLVFWGPLIKFFQHNEGERRENCDVASESVQLANFHQLYQTKYLKYPRLSVVCSAIDEVHLLINYK
jgi:hypothetical protein